MIGQFPKKGKILKGKRIIENIEELVFPPAHMIRNYNILTSKNKYIAIFKTKHDDFITFVSSRLSEKFKGPRELKFFI